MISAQCRCWVIRVFYVFPFLFVAMEKYQFEVCANSVESCMEAQAGGADRVELCAGIPEGGTTPSYGEMFIARRVLDSVALHVIIRPRGGDFLYSEMEERIMLADIGQAVSLGVDGLVFGCLTPDGDVDIPLMGRLMEATHGLPVTFHRAFDMCRDPFRAMEDIIGLGCRRILTSGQQPSARQGIGLLKDLRLRAGDRIAVMAGCGVNEENIGLIARETGVREFHFSAREAVYGGMRYRNGEVFMGSGTAHTGEYVRQVTSAGRVRRTIEALTGR